MEIQTRRVSTRLLVLAAYLVMVLVNALANILPLNGVTTGEVSDSYPNLFAPAGLTFAIWGVIYLALAGYVLYQFGLIQKIKRMSSSPATRRSVFYSLLLRSPIPFGSSPGTFT